MVVDFSQFHWNVITFCERENAYGDMIPAEWFILNAPYATREEAEAAQAKSDENAKGTDAEWPEASAAAKIVHDDDLAQYGLTPLNGPQRQAERRRKVADRFYYSYIANTDDENAIKAIAELIEYGGDLSEIIHKMALYPVGDEEAI